MARLLTPKTRELVFAFRISAVKIFFPASKLQARPRPSRANPKWHFLYRKIQSGTFDTAKNYRKQFPSISSVEKKCCTYDALLKLLLRSERRTGALAIILDPALQGCVRPEDDTHYMIVQ